MNVIFILEIATKEGMAMALQRAARIMLSCKASCGPTVEQQYWNMHLALHDDLVRSCSIDDVIKLASYIILDFSSKCNSRFVFIHLCIVLAIGGSAQWGFIICKSSSSSPPSLLSLVLLLLRLLVLLPEGCCGGIAPLLDAAVQVVHLRFFLLQKVLLVIDLVSEPAPEGICFLVFKACQ